MERCVRQKVPNIVDLNLEFCLSTVVQFISCSANNNLFIFGVYCAHVDVSKTIMFALKIILIAKIDNVIH